MRQLIDDLDDIDEVNKKLKSMGVKIGSRVIDEFYAMNGIGSASSTLDGVAKNICESAIKTFFRTTASYEYIPPNDSTSSFPKAIIRLPENPLKRWVIVPDEWAALDYDAMLCGVFEGALSAIGMNTYCSADKKETKGTHQTIITIELRSIDKEIYEEQEGS